MTDRGKHVKFGPQPTPGPHAQKWTYFPQETGPGSGFGDRAGAQVSVEHDGVAFELDDFAEQGRGTHDRGTMEDPPADYMQNFDHSPSDNNGDLSSLHNLTEDSVLQLIKDRYDKGEIYTKSGDVLISVNPFKPLPIFGDKAHREYSLESLSRATDPLPHVFWLAALAAERRKREGVDQVVLVSGESGAGKTEATKLMVKHILYLSQSQGEHRLYDSIDRMNPLVELFGNARTVLNENSSRFAKFLELKFSDSGTVTGAVIRDYILEKSRVVSPAEGESNFHIFYTFLDDTMSSPHRQADFLMEGMDKCKDFRIVPKSSWRHNQSPMSSQEQADVFREIGLTQEEVNNLHTILAAILHLTNIRFVDDEGSAGGVVIENDDSMHKTAFLLAVSPERLTRVLLTTKKKLGGEVLDIPKSQGRAEEGRDAMAKSLYERLFGWLIRRINTALNRPGQTAAGIGFLDICGFEDLHINSLEQLCINLANENLQSFMNERVFETEMQIYKEEGIHFDNVAAPSNQKILDMFDKNRYGILDLINEDTRLDMTTDEGLVVKLGQVHAESPHYRRHKNDQSRFGIIHFAGLVWYNARNFLEKNRDMVSADITAALIDSSNELISDIFQVKKAPTGSISMTFFKYRTSVKKHSMHFKQPGHVNLSASVVQGLRRSLKQRFGEKLPKMEDPEISNLKNQRTVTDCFKESMKDLLMKMRIAKPFFVRCIKPNDAQTPDNFDERKVLQQLNYNGITEIARIRRVWFPVREPLEHFITRYCELVSAAKTEPTKKQAAELILRQMNVDRGQFKIGNKLVFLKEQASSQLENKLRGEKERQRKEEEERKRREENERRKKEPEVKKTVSPSLATPLHTILEVPTPAPSQYGSSSSINSPIASSCSSGTSEEPADEDDEEDSADSETEVKETHGGAEGGAGGDGASSQEGEKPSSEDDDASKQFWDIFRVVSRERPTTDIQDMRVMKFIKCFAYVFIFFVVLASATTQKVSLMLIMAASNASLTNLNANAGDVKAVRTAHYILLVVAICVPYVLAFLISVGKVAFGAFRSPSLTTWIWVLIFETLHTLGLSLFCFRVLPRLDVLHGLLLLSAAGVFPAILKPLACVEVKTNGRHQDDKIHCVVSAILDFFAFAGQMSVFLFAFLLDNDHYKIKDATTVLDIIGALVFMSFSHWENFLDGCFFVKLKDGNWWKQLTLKRRFEMARGRYIPSLVTSVWKILATIALAYLFRGEQHFNYLSALNHLATLGKQWKAISAIIVLTVTAAIQYYFTYIACKLWMQRVSFTLPLSLATPCAFLVFTLDKRFGFLQEVTAVDISTINPKQEALTDLIEWQAMVGGGVWWLSLLLLTRHVWFPRQSRLAKMESMFMAPVYCGILTTEAILLNRRRHMLLVQKKRIPFAKADTVYHLAGSEKKRNDSEYVDGNEIYASIDDGERNPYATNGAEETDIPMIYACATMWHEVRREMVALLKSLHRLDWEQFIRRTAQELSGTRDKDYFNYEAHIFVDDAMTIDDDDDCIPNDYVLQICDVMVEAVSSVHKKTMTVAPPIKIPTPYGGQLVWQMPGGNLLFVHVKDKAKIRHRKRWSQVMYMYYLLGFRLTRQCQEQVTQALKTGGVDSRSGWRLNEESAIFEILSEDVARKSQNTFVMALDGDTDFSPGSVHILLDRMKKNPRVGAACGRIHPIGSGPMVWYQMFEYAIGHWMQKATEHVLGCVLCSPGCFSLFRGSALMDDNVMRMYTILPTEPGHYLQYDQGEDRWLCTLLLQQGYRVDYAAAADAWTYAPEGFNEFFNQRRRWMPSTLANILDLLSDFSNVVAVNSNISMLYIAYQVALMFATIIGPGTVLMMIAGAIDTVFSLGQAWSYVASIAPAVLFLVVCLKCKTNIQLFLAAFLSTFYTFVMMLVFVGVIITAVEKGIFHPSVLVITVLIIIFVVAGIFHPLELFCLPSGILYLLVIPSGYLLLVIYSLCNLHVVSWGTREVPKKKTKEELEEEKKQAAEKAQQNEQKKGFLGRLFVSSYLSDIKEILQGAMGRSVAEKEDKSIKLLEEINENLKKMNSDKDGASSSAGTSPLSPAAITITIEEPPAKAKMSKPKKKKTVQVAEPPPAKAPRDDLKNPKWIEHKGLGNGEKMELYEEELKFWQAFIERYLKPLDADKKKEEEIGATLIELRNQVVFAVSMINLLWMAINFMFQLKVPITISFKLGNDVVKMDILGMLFMLFLIAVLLLQVIGMFVHRWGTLLHLLAFTDVEFPCFRKKADIKKEDEKNFKKVLAFCKKMYEEPLPDYLDDDGDAGQNHLGRSLKEVLRQTVLGTSTRQLPNIQSSRGANIDPANRRAVELYLHATQRGGYEEDLTAREFYGKFREHIAKNARPEEVLNGHVSNGGAAGVGGSSRWSRGPPLPARHQITSANPHLRRRYANNLRYTVKDAIARAQREAGVSIRPARQDPAPWNNGVGGRYSGDVGTMQRAFSRRMQFFRQFVNEEGSHLGTDIQHV